MKSYRSINRREMLTTTAAGLAATAILSERTIAGEANGTIDLIKSNSSPKQYVVYGGVRRWIMDPQSLVLLGLAGRPLKQLSDAAVNAIPEGQSVLPVWYTIKSPSAPHIYILLNGKRHHIPDEPTFHALGLGFNNVRSIADAQMQSVPLGKPAKSVSEIGPSDIFHAIMDSDPIGCDPGQHYEPVYPILDLLGIGPDIGRCVPGDGGSTFEGNSNSSGDDNTGGSILAFGTISTVVRHGTDVFRLFPDPADVLRQNFHIPLPPVRLPPIPNPFPGRIHIHFPRV
jgi:hypothetical protein